jgi:hypothetical protein
MHRAACTLAIVGFLTSIAHGDTWLPPTVEHHYSANRKFRATLIPQRASDPRPGFAQLSLFRGDGIGVPRVIFSRRQLLWYRQVASFPLLNPVAPVHVLIDNSGRFVATLDDWHQVGYGPNVVVIYRSEGTLIRRLSLRDMVTAGDAETFSRSVSSIGWRGRPRIDDVREQLVIPIGGDRPPSGAPYWPAVALRLRLASGELVGDKRDRFPHQKPDVTMVAPRAFISKTGVLPPMAGRRCVDGTTRAFDDPAVALLRWDDLSAEVPRLRQPTFPPIALEAKIAGPVRVQFLVAPDGSVACTRTSSQGILAIAAHEAVSSWTLASLARSEWLQGEVVFMFGIKWTDPLATNAGTPPAR